MKLIILLAIISMTICSQLNFLENNTVKLDDTNQLKSGEVIVSENCLDVLPITNTKITLSSNTIIPGTQFSVDVQATANQDVQAQYLLITVLYQGQLVTTFKQYMMKNYNKGENFSYSYSKNLPSDMASGNYIVTGNIFSGLQIISCFGLQFSL